jgi:hypothetical protein
MFSFTHSNIPAFQASVIMWSRRFLRQCKYIPPEVLRVVTLCMWKKMFRKKFLSPSSGSKSVWLKRQFANGHSYSRGQTRNFDLYDGNSMFIWNVGKQWQRYTVSQSRSKSPTCAKATDSVSRHYVT